MFSTGYMQLCVDRARIGQRVAVCVAGALLALLELCISEPNI